MLHTLRACLSSDRFATVMIATGYWDIPGLALLTDDIRNFLDRDGTKLLLLLGKDPYIYAAQVNNPKYKGSAYPQDFIRTDIDELDPKEEYKNAIRLLLDYCTENDDSKMQIRIFNTNEDDQKQFLHSKCYIFDGRNIEGIGYGIIGSSNFTEKGLQGNAELNFLETDATKVLSETYIPNHKTHIQWFKEKWNLSEPWNKVFLEQVLRKVSITSLVEKDKAAAETDPFTPYELYIKLLQIKFGDIVDKDLGRQIESYLPSEMKTLNYQIEAVKRCISIMHEHGGFMLSDVVGLGKTVVGVLLIRRFLTVPEDDGRERRVLIITPPAIQSSWKETVADFDREQAEKIEPSIDYITTGSIGNLVGDDDDDDDEEDNGDFNGGLEYRNYGLIIIDESHKFRNSDTFMYKALDDLIQKIGANTGVYPYMGLLSATPQNNRPNDIKNQLYLFERNRTDSTLKKAYSGNIDKFFAEANRKYDALIKAIDGETEEQKKQREGELKTLSGEIRECVLDDILERRTRTDVKEYYKEDTESQHLVFPEIKGPFVLKYEMDKELSHLFADTMTIIAPTREDKLRTDRWLEYYRYRAIQFFLNEINKKKYEGRGSISSDKVAEQLAGIMQIMLVKRLESSFAAFTASLGNLRRYTENMINMWENDTIFVCPQIDVNQELDEVAKTHKRGRTVTFAECVDDIRAIIKRLDENGRNDKHQNAEYRRSDFDPSYFGFLKTDYKLISSLCDRWAMNSEDPKFESFKEQLKPTLFDPLTNTSGKLVIFSEAIDTVKSLERAVRKRGFSPLVITAANRQSMELTIKENFDANFDGEQKDDYQVIITTDVLAEGINLHRANVILNYDTPWNSTRLMQRIGRVNRIGSKDPCVYVYNFMPSAQGDAEIQLVRKAHTKLQSFHILFGEDSKIFSQDEEVAQYALHNAIDGPESPMEKYVFELKQYKEANPDRYKKIVDTAQGWVIASKTQGNAYFMVKAKNSAGLAIRVAQDGIARPQIISAVEMIEAVRVDKNTPASPLPDNWSQLSADAILTYNQYFVRINKSRAGDKATLAMQIIYKMYDQDNLSKHSKELLKYAMKMVRDGNIDIINRMIEISEHLNVSGYAIFKLEQADIDNVLEAGIGKLVASVEQKQGKAEITLATCN